VKRGVLLLPLLLLASGCALFESVPTTFAGMSHTQRAAWLTATYNQEYDAYLAKAENPSALTQAEKGYLRAKKDALTAAWPLINVYCQMVKAGLTDDVRSQEAYTAMTAVLAVGGGKIGG
jgi:hypothetical protein